MSFLSQRGTREMVEYALRDMKMSQGFYSSPWNVNSDAEVQEQQREKKRLMKRRPTQEGEKSD